MALLDAWKLVPDLDRVEHFRIPSATEESNLHVMKKK
jgi:hypothetical protein